MVEDILKQLVERINNNWFHENPWDRERYIEVRIYPRRRYLTEIIFVDRRLIENAIPDSYIDYEACSKELKRRGVNLIELSRERYVKECKRLEEKKFEKMIIELLVNNGFHCIGDVWDSERRTFRLEFVRNI